MIHFFVNTTGPKNISFFSSNFKSLNQVIRLSGYRHDQLQEILSQVLKEAEEQGVEVQAIHHCLDNSLQGLIFPRLSSGVFGFDGSSQEVLCPLAEDNEAAVSLTENLRQARETFQQARSFHNQKEAIYLSEMDFAAANVAAERTVSLLLEGAGSHKGGKEVHRFFGGATAQGNLDYIEEITAELPRRFFLKGRPGTGKSTFLKKIAAAALAQGFDTDIYHCALDPKSLDMVVIPGLGCCLLDSTAPHEYFPSREGDEIVDLYQECVTPGTDEKYHEKLTFLESEYKSLIKKALGFLQSAQEANHRFEETLPLLDETALQNTAGRLSKSLLQK